MWSAEPTATTSATRRTRTTGCYAIGRILRPGGQLVTAVGGPRHLAEAHEIAWFRAVGPIA